MSKRSHRSEPLGKRRAQFAAETPRARVKQATLVIVGAAVVFVATTLYVIAGRRPEPGPHSSAPLLNGDVRLDTAQFDDGQARFYRYTAADGREIRFFVLKSADGVIRAAFDTCDVCYREKKGYRQVGDTMVCNNCGQTFRSADINVVKGGCNPVPLDRVVQNGQVVLTATALQAGAFYF
jgi:uncharacterized membrane protein